MAVISSFSSPVTFFTTVILFWVRVPVLSEQIIWVHPRVSTAVSFRMMAWFALIFVTPMDSSTVTTALSPSGIAATASETAIMARHLLPNVFHLVIIYFTLNCAGAIMLEVIVSYLGFGVQNLPSWGIMISDGQERLWRGVWWELAGATGFMFFLVLALNLLGDALRDALDPR